jgi:hypothetical protein
MKVKESFINVFNYNRKEEKGMKKLTSILAMSLLAVALSSPAYATTVTGLFNNAPTNTLLSDNSAELFFDVNTNGVVDVGDIFVTIVGINTIGPTTIGSGTGFNEVTAINAIKIATASDVDLGPIGPDDSFGTQSIDLFQYTAVPLTAADSGIFDWSSLGLGPNNGTLFAAVYEDPAQDYTRDSTIAAGIASATNGTNVLTLGLVGANSDFLSVIAPRTIASIGTIPFATAIDNTNISLDGTILTQNWGPLFFNENVTGGNGGFSSPTEASGFPIFDNLDFTLTATTVPEPGTFALLGLGLLGAGLYRRIRRRE